MLHNPLQSAAEKQSVNRNQLRIQCSSVDLRNGQRSVSWPLLWPWWHHYDYDIIYHLTNPNPNPNCSGCSVMSVMAPRPSCGRFLLSALLLEAHGLIITQAFPLALRGFKGWNVQYNEPCNLIKLRLPTAPLTAVQTQLTWLALLKKETNDIK